MPLCGREFGAGLVRVRRAWGRRRGDGRSGVPGAALSGGRRDRGRHPRRADAAARGRAADGRSCSAAVAARTSARSRRSRPARSAWAVIWFDAHGDLNTPASSRPQTPGDAAPHGDRRRRLQASHVALIGAAELDPPGGPVHRVEPASAGEDAIARRSTARTPSTWRSTATVRARRARRLHARAGRAPARARSKMCCAISPPAPRSPVSGSRASSAIQRNEPKLARLCRRLGL